MVFSCVVAVRVSSLHQHTASDLKLDRIERDRPMDVNSHIASICLKPHHSHRTITNLDVPTDIPAEESVTSRTTQIPVLMIVINDETTVIVVKAKVTLFGRVHECTQTDHGYGVGKINDPFTFYRAEINFAIVVVLVIVVSASPPTLMRAENRLSPLGIARQECDTDVVVLTGHTGHRASGWLDFKISLPQKAYASSQQ